jgi:hypothetical protein
MACVGDWRQTWLTGTTGKGLRQLSLAQSYTHLYVSLQGPHVDEYTCDGPIALTFRSSRQSRGDGLGYLELIDLLGICVFVLLPSIRGTGKWDCLVSAISMDARIDFPDSLSLAVIEHTKSIGFSALHF